MIHTTAIVHPNAELGDDVEVGPYCIVGAHVKIGARTRLLAHVVVNGHTTVGDDVTVHPFATIGASSQDRKTVVGETAFTRIGNRTEIREYVSVHRGTGEGSLTSVGDDCLLLAYAHVAHNSQLGNFVTMSNLAQIAGHVQVDDYATISGAAGVHQHVRIGRHAFVGGMTPLKKDVPPFFVADGNPPRVGINTTGLDRHAYSREERAEIKRCFRTLYYMGHNISQAVDALRGTLHTPAGAILLEFLEAPSERGIIPALRKSQERSDAADATALSAAAQQVEQP